MASWSSRSCTAQSRPTSQSQSAASRLQNSCAVPKLQGGIKSRQMISQMVEEVARTGRLRAISLTSGVEVSPQAEAERRP